MLLALLKIDFLYNMIINGRRCAKIADVIIMLSAKNMKDLQNEN